jgi:hypothetical protein
MNKKRFAQVAAIVLLCLSCVSAAAAPEPVLVRSVIAGGGQTVTDGATMVLAGTIGESIVGPPQAVGGYQVAAGYWRDLPPQYKLHLPILRR